MQKANTDAADLQLVRELRSAPQRELPEPLEELKEKVIHTLYVDLNHLDGSELLDELVDKSYQYGVEAERKQHNWWGNFDNYHAHCINGEHFIGKNPGYGCDECKRVFGTGYTDSLTNQGETK